MNSILSEQSLAALIEIRGFFDSPLGMQVLQTEQEILDQLLNGFFGYHLLQVSVQQQSLYGASPIQHKFSLGLAPSDNVPVIARATELPLQNDSIDVIVLHHLLDFLASPLDTLREIARVSLPMGYLVIVGFNPFSMWGLWKISASLSGKVPWNGRFILPARLMDWLNVLNFRIDGAQYCIYKPPVTGKSIKRPDDFRELNSRANYPFGAVYVIVARKQIGTLTPLRPVWHTDKALAQLGVVRPARRDQLRLMDHQE